MHSLLSVRSHPAAHPAAAAVTPTSAEAVPPARRRYFDGQRVDAINHQHLRARRRRAIEHLVSLPREPIAATAPKAELSQFVAILATTFVADGVIDAGGKSRDFFLGLAPAAAHKAAAVPRTRWWQWRRADAPAPPPPLPLTRTAWQRLDDALARLLLTPFDVGQALSSATLTAATLIVAVPVSLGAGAVALAATRLALRHANAEAALKRQEQLQMLLSLERRFGHVVGTDAWLAQLEAPVPPLRADPTDILFEPPQSDSESALA